MTFYQKDSPEFPTSETLNIFQQTSQYQTLLQHRLLTSLSVPKEKDLAHQIQETVFPVLPDRSLNYDLNTLSSKTYQNSLTVPSCQTATTNILATSFSSLPRSGMVWNGLLSALKCSDRPSLEKNYFWLDSPTALSRVMIVKNRESSVTNPALPLLIIYNQDSLFFYLLGRHSGKGQPPGQTKLKSRLRQSNIIQKTKVLDSEWLEVAFNLPTGWSDPEESPC